MGIVQGNIDQAIKWDPSYQEKTLNIYQNLTYKVAKPKLDLVIWPETAIPFFLEANLQYKFSILGMLQKLDCYLLGGGLGYSFKEGEVKYFNSAFLISPKEGIVGRYDKIHLVPFGEYVPLRGLLPFVEKMVEGASDFSPGKEIVTFSLPKGRFGVLICYETIFPNLVRRFVKKGADFLVNITNDAWFGNTSAPYQHASMAVFRAIENRVFIVRAANTGVSLIIEATGRISLEGGLFKPEILKGGLRKCQKTTLYTQYGDIFAYICLGITMVFIVLGLTKSQL